MQGERKDFNHSRTFLLMETGSATYDEKYLRSRRRWDYFTRTREVAPAPLHVDIETTNLCDLKCIMCERKDMKRPKGAMSMELFKSIIRQCDEIGVDSVKLALWGEPFLNPRLVDMVRWARENSSLILQCNTNANLMTPGKSRGLVRAGLDQLSISIDGVTKETYESIRVGGNYERVMANVHHLMDVKKEMGAGKPCVTLQIIRMSRNEHEIAEFVEYWKKKADRIAVTNIGVTAGSREVLSLSLREHKRTGRRPCSQLWQRLSVYWDGTVNACCNDFDGFLTIGRIDKDHLQDLWHGKDVSELRERHKRCDFQGLVCDECVGTVVFGE